jgi:hypothetical protein
MPPCAAAGKEPGVKKMNVNIAKYCSAFIFLAVTLSFSSCAGGGGGGPLTDLQRYDDAGSSVAAKEYSENYDCSNYSTQFYQNCYKAGLPCRVRLGKAGGEAFSDSGVDHAWNSVKIEGQWVDWEPQLNRIYTGHVQEQTKDTTNSGITYIVEDIVRIIYETVGKYVPRTVIDTYEIDDNWATKPFLPYYIPLAECISDSDDAYSKALVNYLKTQLIGGIEGDIFIDDDADAHFHLFFRYNNAYYAVFNIDESDPPEGRAAAGGKAGDPSFERLNIAIDYQAK